MSEGKRYKFSSIGNRRFRVLPSNPWLPYVGDCKALDNFLNSKQGIGWYFPKYLNALLRGVSQVLFANNPLTGLIILLSLFWADPIVGSCTLLAAITALFTSFAMRQDTGSIYAGLTTYNAVLVGSVTSSLWEPLFHEEMSLKVWIFIVLGSAMSVFVTNALSNFLGSLKIPLPPLTLPFNIVTLLLFTILMPPLGPGGSGMVPMNDSSPTAAALTGIMTSTTAGGSSRATRQVEGAIEEVMELADELVGGGGMTSAKNGSNHQMEALNWGQMMSGIIVAGSQVYGVENLVGAILIYIALLIYSPILCCMAVFGSIIGSISGILFAPAHGSLYAGLWGFNAILSSAAVGGFFVVMTCHSFFLALANILFTVAIQQALSIAFGPLRLPVFTLPFCLSTLIFLLFTTAGNHLPRVQNITFPEMHRYEYLVALEEERKAGAGSTADEKELVLKDIKVIDDDEKKGVVEDDKKNGEEMKKGGEEKVEKVQEP